MLASSDESPLPLPPPRPPLPASRLSTNDEIQDKEPTFMFPVNDLEVGASPRGRPFSPPPLARGSATPMLATAYDEFSRDWVHVTIGRLAQKTVPW